MTLKDRITANGMTVAEVAERAGTQRPHLYNILNRVRKPRLDLALSIEAATHGLISWQELINPAATQPSSPSLDEMI
jgi:transcriptional regulator with XRE-family HTH domain